MRRAWVVFHAAIVLSPKASEERKETLERFTGLSLMACQGERRDRASIRKGSIRNNRNRPTAPFDRLIVLLQRKIGARFLPIVDTLI